MLFDTLFPKFVLKLLPVTSIDDFVDEVSVSSSAALIINAHHY